MVDQQRRRARVGDLPEPLAEILALVRVEAGRRLVQAEEPRLHRDRPGHADELALPLGQLGGHRLGERAEIEQRERLLRGSALGDALSDELGGEREERRALGGHAEVLPDREVVEQLRALPGPGEPTLCSDVRR